MKKLFTLCATICYLFMAVFATPVTALAATEIGPGVTADVNVMRNPYYNEVSMMASTISSKLPTELERSYLYDACMTNVFGAKYHNQPSQYADGALIHTMTTEEKDSLPISFLCSFMRAQELRWPSGKLEVYTVEPIELNAEGISESGYQEVKAVYQAYVTLQNQTSSMTDEQKIRSIYDYILSNAHSYKQTANDETASISSHYIGYALVHHTAWCSAFASMFYLLGTANGLQVTIDEDHINHANNTVMVNGELKHMDLMWDSSVGYAKYYLTKECSDQKEHTYVH